MKKCEFEASESDLAISPYFLLNHTMEMPDSNVFSKSAAISRITKCTAENMRRRLHSRETGVAQR